jgi:hypothetical protein
MVKFDVPDENEDDIEDAQNEEDLKPLRSVSSIRSGPLHGVRSIRSSFRNQVKKAQSTLT